MEHRCDVKYATFGSIDEIETRKLLLLKSMIVRNEIANCKHGKGMSWQHVNLVTDKKVRPVICDDTPFIKYTMQCRLINLHTSAIIK